jgi:tetratricopeptide (TPR) repeat protein
MKYLILAVIMLSFAIPGAHASYKDALELFDAGKYKESLAKIAEELTVANDKDPNSPNYKLRYLAAHNHWKLGKFESSISHFKRCMDIQKDNVNACVDMSLLLIDMKKYKDAEIYIKKGLKIKEDPMLFYASGKMAFMKENYWKAKELFEKAISLDPELYVSYHSLGVTLMRLGKFSQANTAFSASLSMSPKSSVILNNVGLSFEKMGNAEEALRHYEKALTLSPENKVIKENLGRARAAAGKTEKK